MIEYDPTKIGWDSYVLKLSALDNHWQVWQRVNALLPFVVASGRDWAEPCHAAVRAARVESLRDGHFTYTVAD